MIFFLTPPALWPALVLALLFPPRPRSAEIIDFAAEKRRRAA